MNPKGRQGRRANIRVFKMRYCMKRRRGVLGDSVLCTMRWSDAIDTSEIEIVRSILCGAGFLEETHVDQEQDA